MTLTRDEAAQALADMEAAQNRSSVLARYAVGGPILMLWGAEWFVCNLVSQYGGGAARWAWPLGTLLTIAVTFWLSRRSGTRRGQGWRAFGTSMAILAFFLGLFTILRLTDVRQVNAVISLAVALAYLVLGIWTGARYVWMGAGMAVAIMIGWLVFPAWFFLWMAIVGGGALALGGLWLRRA